MAEKSKEASPTASGNKDDSKGGGDSLEGLMSTLHKQIKGSDWLKQNTAEKWEDENKEVATEFKKAKESKEWKEEKPGS